MSTNDLRTRNGQPFNFVDGVKIKGVDLEESLLTIQNSLDQIQYVAPVITAFTINGSSALAYEKGVSVANLNMAWSLSGSVPNAQSINNGVGTVAVGTLIKTITGPFTVNATYSLTVTDTNPSNIIVTATRSATISFMQKRHWGVSVNASLDSAGILALSGNELSSVKGKTVVYDATGGRYVYYAYPDSYGALALSLIHI